MVKVAFTGSFDPPHEGHKYVVEQARKLGFEVQVVVANNVNKQYRYSPLERVNLCYELFSFDDVCVMYSDLTNIGESIKNAECSAIIRGLRNEEDYKYEQEIADYNLSVNGLPTIYIQSPIELREVSSSVIKKING